LEYIETFIIIFLETAAGGRKKRLKLNFRNSLSSHSHTHIDMIFNVKIVNTPTHYECMLRKTSLDFHDRYIYYYFAAASIGSASLSLTLNLSRRLFSLSAHTFHDLEEGKLESIAQ
jgi:hypothetical protein